MDVQEELEELVGRHRESAEDKGPVPTSVSLEDIPDEELRRDIYKAVLMMKQAVVFNLIVNDGTRTMGRHYCRDTASAEDHYFVKRAMLKWLNRELDGDVQGMVDDMRREATELFLTALRDGDMHIVIECAAEKGYPVAQELLDMAEEGMVQVIADWKKMQEEQVEKSARMEKEAQEKQYQ